MKISKNALTISQLQLACRHVEEMIAANVTENFAIRTLELFADIYAKCHMGGKGQTSPHHAKQVELWSVASLGVLQTNPHAMARPGDYFRVEHGTPRRGFARKVLSLYQHHKELNEVKVKELVERHWKLAVITLDEDQLLNKKARSQVYDTPEERWMAAGIEFPADIPT